MVALDEANADRDAVAVVVRVDEAASVSDAETITVIDSDVLSRLVREGEGVRTAVREPVAESVCVSVCVSERPARETEALMVLSTDCFLETVRLVDRETL